MIRRAIGIGSLAVLALAGCRGGEQQEQEAQEPSAQVEESQQEAEKSLERAQQAQGEAGKQQEEASQAQEELQKSQQELAEAQQKAQQEGQQAAQAQQQAQQEAQAAQQQTEQSQQQAMEAQQQQAQQPPAGGAVAQQQQSVSGPLVEASTEEIRVGETGNEMTIKVTESTQVWQNGQNASLQDLQPGSQVRASYEVQNGEPVATRIEASGGSLQQQPQQQPQPQPQPEGGLFEGETEEQQQFGQ